MQPIFIGVTRSFWLTVMGILSMLEAGEPVIRGFLTLVAPVFGFNVDAGVEWVASVAPLVLWGAALYERRGNNRPYTVDPRCLK